MWNDDEITTWEDDEYIPSWKDDLLEYDRECVLSGSKLRPNFRIFEDDEWD